MANICFGLSGEGRGHATRVKTLVDDLRLRHSISIYTSGMAYDFLHGAYADSDVEVNLIPGLRFHYKQSNKISYFSSGIEAITYIAKLRKTVEKTHRSLERAQPDMILTDFEPLLPRAAKKMGLPYVSLNHQHFLLTYDLTSLPIALQRHAAFMSRVVKTYYQEQIHTIVSSFYFPPLRKGITGVTQIGVLLTSEIIEAIPEDREHIVVYLRRFEAPKVLEALTKVGRQAYVYGLGEHPSIGNIKFCKIDPKAFVEHLSTACLLVSTAGNQLIGEALYLNKPVLAMPEVSNYEQAINAHFLEKSGAGRQVQLDLITRRDITTILDNPDQFTRHIDRGRLKGNDIAIEFIENYLSQKETGAMLNQCRQIGAHIE